MNDWLKLAFLGLLGWLAWKLLPNLTAAGPAAIYQFGDIISAPAIIGAMPGAKVGSDVGAATVGNPAGQAPISNYDGLRAAAYGDPRRGYEAP